MNQAGAKRGTRGRTPNDYSKRKSSGVGSRTGDHAFKNRAQRRLLVHDFTQCALGHLYLTTSPLSACTLSPCTRSNIYNFLGAVWLITTSPIVTMPSLRPSILLPAVLHATQLSRALHIELPRYPEAHLPKLAHTSPMPRPSTSRVAILSISTSLWHIMQQKKSTKYGRSHSQNEGKVLINHVGPSNKNGHKL